MGTRNLVAVKLDGKYKIAQYGQWDGCPSGQGKTVLEFLSTWNREEFEKKLRAASYATENDLTSLDFELEADKSDDKKDFWKTHSQFSRDTGAKILQVVQDSPEGIKLKNEIVFVEDSLFCKYYFNIVFNLNIFNISKEIKTELEEFFCRYCWHKLEIMNYGPQWQCILWFPIDFK